MRMLLAGLCLLASMLSVPACAATRAAGVWLFTAKPSFPGVTMMQVATDGGTVRGTVTTKWYGPMRMQNAVLRGNTLSFDLRNLNDKERQF